MGALQEEQVEQYHGITFLLHCTSILPIYAKNPKCQATWWIPFIGKSIWRKKWKFSSLWLFFHFSKFNFHFYRRPMTRGISPTEVQGLEAVLKLITSVCTYSEAARITIAEHATWQPTFVFVGLLRYFQ